MGTQQQAQQPPVSQGRKSSPRKTLLIITIVIMALIIAAAWLLSSLGKLPGIWATIISIVVTLIGVVASLWPYINSSEKTEATTTTPSMTTPTYQIPPIIVQVPPTPPAPQPVSTPQPNKAPYRGIVSLPPPTDPKTIQQREKAVRQIYEKLTQPDITAIVLTGIGGAGKSTLAALVYNYAEEQCRIGKGPFTTEPLWLRVDPAITMADLAGNIVEALGKSLPDLSSLSPENQAVALFNAMKTVAEPRLVILDQFENLLDLHTGYALSDCFGIGEWLDIINSQKSTCRVLLTSRRFPQGMHGYPPTHMQEYPVGGLKEAEAIELLKKLGVKGTELEMRTAVERCDGHALSLTLLASILRSNQSLNVQVLLTDPMYSRLWTGGTGNIARNLLDYIYTRQLDEVQRSLLLAFSIYRIPVPLEATRPLLDVKMNISEEQLLTALNVLLAQHLLQAEGRLQYQLHPIVASYAHDHFDERDKGKNQRARREAHAKAVKYYEQGAVTNCPPREQRRGVSDVHFLTEAVWQYCQAEWWQEAYELMVSQGLFADLKRWGGNAILLELCQPLLKSEKWHPELAQIGFLSNYLGGVYRDLGQKQESLCYFKQALQIYREVKDRWGEGVALNNLGLVYDDLSQKKEALNCYEQALEIKREVRDRKGEGTILNNLGLVYNALGRKKEALNYYERALEIKREVRDREGEGTILNNLGGVYSALDQKQEALDYYERALKMTKEVGNRRGEGATLNNLALVFNALGQKKEALDHYERALQIRREVEDRGGEGTTVWNIGVLYFEQDHYNVALACFLLARTIFEEVQSLNCNRVQNWIDDLRSKVGEKQFAALLAQVEPQAYQIVERALREGL